MKIAYHSLGAISRSLFVVSPSVCSNECSFEEYDDWDPIQDCSGGVEMWWFSSDKWYSSACAYDARLSGIINAVPSCATKFAWNIAGERYSWYPLITSVFS